MKYRKKCMVCENHVLVKGGSYIIPKHLNKKGEICVASNLLTVKQTRKIYETILY